ncbi:MAG: phosphoglycerate dehydrogenase [Planctomycetota bacterium]
MKVLISDKVASEAVEKLAATEGIEVENAPGLEPDRLKARLAEADGIIVRSGTKLTAGVLEAAARLKIIVRAGVGVDNLDIPAASRRGVIVCNTPGGNTLSTAEHTCALLLALSRNVYPACRSLKEGQWDRKKFMGTQLAGKTIGVVGLGRIGLEVARRAAAFQMTVLGYDPYVTAERAKQHRVTLVDDLHALYAQADYVTVHVPVTDETRGMLGAEQLAAMKDGVKIINCARGEIIDEAALAEALRSGKVAGAALDVYPAEPPTNRELIDMDQVLCTPHLGASTEEAQLNVALEAADIMADALLHNRIRNALNVPAIAPAEAEALQPYADLARCLGLFQTQTLRRVPSRVRVTYGGDAAALNTRIVTAHLLAGLLAPVLEEDTNYINAPYLAEERGIHITEATTDHVADFTTLVSMALTVDGEEHEVAGTLVGKGEPRIVLIDGYRVEAMTRGTMVILFAEDKPGLIGSVGGLLGERGINIAAMTFGRKEAGGAAITVLNLDGPVDDAARDAVRQIPHVHQVHVVRF